MSAIPNSLSLFGIADITYLLAKMEVLRQGGEESDRVGEKVHCCDEVRSSFLPYEAIVCVSNFSCSERQFFSNNKYNNQVFLIG